jgi:hypothetical protein
MFKPSLSVVDGGDVGGGDGGDDDSNSEHGGEFVSDAMMRSSPKSVLDCKFAKDCNHYDMKRTNFILDDVDDASWQGKLWGRCQPCSGLDAAEFRRESRRLWVKRANTMRGKRVRARSITWNNVHEKLAECFKGATKVQLHKLATLRTKAMAAAYIKAFTEMNEFEQAAVAQINEEYFTELKKAADDPSYAASVDGHTLCAEEASYLTVIAAGITESFVCRMPDCWYFGMNDQWIKRKCSWHFKCPACGEQYRPAADYKGSSDFSLVIGLTDPETGQPSFIPATWPPSNEQGWVNKMVELHASQLKDEGDLVLWNSKAKKDLKQLINNQRIPSFFTQIPYDGTKIANRLSSQWAHEPIMEKGYFTGAFLSAEDAKQPAYRNWNELIGLIANCVASARALVRARM